MLKKLADLKSVLAIFTVLLVVSFAIASSFGAPRVVSTFNSEEEQAKTSSQVNLVEEILHLATSEVVVLGSSIERELLYPDHINLIISTLIFDLTKPPSYS
jgi:hypothetical protein